MMNHLYRILGITSSTGAGWDLNLPLASLGINNSTAIYRDSLGSARTFLITGDLRLGTVTILTLAINITLAFLLTKWNGHCCTIGGTLQGRYNVLYILNLLSHRRDTITFVWYYVSRLCDTLFETSFKHRKKYLAEVLSFGPCNSECIRSKNPFKIIFGAKKFS